jgi:hypothetical protein
MEGRKYWHFGNFGHFGSQKVPKCSKIVQNSLLGRFKVPLSEFSQFGQFLRIFVDFLLSKRFFERVGRVPLFWLKGGGRA